MPRFITFECGKPHVEAIDATLQFGDDSLITVVIEMAAIGGHDAAHSCNCQSDEWDRSFHARGNRPNSSIGTKSPVQRQSRRGWVFGVWQRFRTFGFGTTLSLVVAEGVCKDKVGQSSRLD